MVWWETPDLERNTGRDGCQSQNVITNEQLLRICHLSLSNDARGDHTAPHCSRLAPGRQPNPRKGFL
ncbi:hypothetical protein MMA231_01537 [Asticcacaulis sp. MM231]